MKVLAHSLHIVEVANGCALYGDTPQGEAVFLAHLGDGSDGLPDPHDPDLAEAYDFEVVLEPADCPQCGGTGVLFPGATVGMWAGLVRWPDSVHGETCELCDGTGQVPTDLAEQYEASLALD